MATDKGSAYTQLTEMTECCICLKTFTDPRTLPCIHTFCFQCLQEMVDNSDKKTGDEIQCPMCRKEFTLPNDGVQGIQKTFFMAGMIEVRSALNQSTVTVTSCDVCKTNTESDISEATSRCLDCQENLCEDCYKTHKVSKLSRNHKVQKIDDGVGKERTIKTLNVMNCDIHRGKALDYYCAECRKVVCVSCFVEGHKTHDCKDVNSVDGEFRQTIKSSADKISTLVGELLTKKEKSKNKEDFLTKIDEREKEILRRIDELKQMIDTHTRSLMSSLEEIKNRRLKEIQASEDELDRQLMIVESFKRYCDELRLNGSASDICRSRDALLLRAEVIEDDYEKYIMCPHASCDVTFLPTDLDNFLKTTHGSMIGILEEKDDDLESFAVMITKAGSNATTSRKINLHCKSDKVSLIEFLPTTFRSYPASAVYNNTVFLTGIGEDLNEIWKYNFSSGWRRCGSLVQGRYRHCAEFIEETLYICGGGKPGSVINNVEAYNAVTEKSTEVGHLGIGCFWADCVAYKGSIYVFGGMDTDQNRLNCVQVFNSVEKTSTFLSTPIPCPIAHMRALLWNDYAILLGRDTCFILDFENQTWQERKQFKTDTQADYFGAVLENERIFIIDGLPFTFLSRLIRVSKLLLVQGEDVKYIRASSILNNETPKWRTRGQLSLPFDIRAIPKMPLFK